MTSSATPSQPSGARRPRARITACLIVQDEQERLADALQSVAFCDEIVVVDGGSADGTPEIARRAGARVIENPWPGYAAQRNVALDAASTEWILEIDADERVSAHLRESIEALLTSAPSEVEIAVCPLRNRFLGAPLGPSAKYPAYRARVFRRGVYRHDEERAVHEGIEPRERPVVLAGDLEHALAGTLREALADTWRYGRLESRHVPPPAGAYGYVVGIVLRPAAKSAYRLIVDGSWRDGWRGLLKVALDVACDALVWILVLTRTPRDSAVDRDVALDMPTTHFGRRHAGTPKVVALASGSRSTRAGRQWLGGLQAAGIDVALIGDDDNGHGEIPERPIHRLRLLRTMRALDIEMQLRTIDSVVPVGRRARLVSRLLPRTLRPEIAGLSAKSSSETAALLVHTAVATSRPA